MPSRARGNAFEDRRTAMAASSLSERAYRLRARRKLLQGWPWEIRLHRPGVDLSRPAGRARRWRAPWPTSPRPFPTRWPCALKERAPIVRVLARDGSVLSERGGDGAYMPVDLLPQHLIDAVLATEDRRFFEHWGVDPTGLMRAMLRQPARRARDRGRLDADAAARQEPVPGLRAHASRASSRSCCWPCGWRRGSASATSSSSTSTASISAAAPTAWRRRRAASSASRRAR